jgi:deoxyribonuclease V
MEIPRIPHSWAVTAKQAIAIQRRLASSVRPTRPRRRLRLIAGVDAAFSRDGKHCIAAAVVWDLEDRRVVEQRTARRRLRFPYVPGLLSFREAPAVIAALRSVECEPDVIMCDAHGLAHPRRFGLACHVGVICGIPTIGCAKSRLTGTHRPPAVRRGSRVQLVDGIEVVGSVVRTREGIRPVYVSVGHLIDLRTAEQLVLESAVRFRLPEPTRLADKLVGQTVG